MSRQTDTKIIDAGHPGKYFHFMLNMADDDLDPYEYRLLGHYRRVCGLDGKCTQSVREIASICRMSTGMVTKARTRLAEKGWITAERKKEKGADIGYVVTVIDRMKENTERYTTKAEGVHEVNTPVHEVNTRVHQVKQRINKNKNQQETNAASAAQGEPPLKVISPAPERPKRPIFDAIALGSFNIKDSSAVGEKGGRIGKLEAWVKKNYPGATEVTITALYAWLKRTYPKMTPPRDLEKFSERFIEFHEAMTSKGVGASGLSIFKNAEAS